MKKTLLSTAAALCIALSVPFGAAYGMHDGMNDNDAVRDFQGDVIKNSFDNCVVTKWEGGGYGCEKPESPGEMLQINTELLNVYFNFDQDTLTPSAQDKLDKVVQMLKTAKNVNSVDIIGYADFLGNPAYNDALSKRRAESVRHYIESRGYFNTRNVSVIGLGEEQPITDCTGLDGSKLKACLWRDRRVEIQLNYQK